MPLDYANAAAKWFGRRPDQLGPSERKALDRAVQRRTLIEDPNLRLAARSTLGERVSDQVARLGGSWTFIALFVLFLLAWVALFHIADAAQTIAAFVLRAYRIATVPLLVYVLAIWGIGLGGGYVVAFDLAGISPSWAQAAQGFWAMSTLGLTIAGIGMTAFLAWTLRRQRRAAEVASVRALEAR